MRRFWLLYLAGITCGVVAAQPGCTAGDGSTFGDDDDDTSSSSGQGAEGGLNLNGGNGQGGNNFTYCEEPSCVGNTPQGNCDQGLAIDSGNAMDGARAIGICQEAQPGTWGVVSAEWVRSDLQPLSGPFAIGKGILSNFGPMSPREGSSMLVLSSGTARDPGDPGFEDPAGVQKDPMTSHGAPPGYPKESPDCPGVTTGDPYDSAGLKLVIRTPTDAKSFTFDFDFYTYEYPDFICSTFNDFFVAMLDPKLSTLPDGNISFDSNNNTISVNAGFLEVCNVCDTPKTFACSLGYGEINGTGFESNVTFSCAGGPGSAATSWLVTTAPVENPGSEVTLHFAIWDSGDAILDSTVLVDNFKFALEEGTAGTIPAPK